MTTATAPPEPKKSGKILSSEQARAMGRKGGRPKGSRDKVKVVMKELAALIVCNEKVQAKLVAQAEAGTLHPRLMVELFHYYGGRPVHKVQVEQVVSDADAEERRRQIRAMPKAERLQLAELIMRANRLQLPPADRAKVIDVKNTVEKKS